MRRWEATGGTQEAVARRHGVSRTKLRHGRLLNSLVQSFKLVDVPPFEYLKDVLFRAAIHLQRLLGQLTPKGCVPAFGHATA